MKTSFRDRLPTADEAGHRRWIYPKKPSGRYYRWRTLLSWGLLAIMFAGPFIRINGNPLLLFNIVERRFSILGQIFWPQDTAIFAVGFLLFCVSIVVFTTAFGRLWCGWACPQTLLMEMVFRKIEYVIEGDGPAQKRLRAAPWTTTKTFKKLIKHGIFFALSWVIANTLLSYIIGAEALLQLITDDPRNHLTGLTSMVLFTGIFYLIFARFREQACTFICPYGRFQSVMLDENSLVVAYDHKRGEGRARWIPTQSVTDRQAAGVGDCINCNQCVAVCPTGIDIRNGTQMECVNCTACIDACDEIMDRIRRPRGLIRYASLNSIERGQRFRFTSRLAACVGVLLALAGVLGWMLLTRSPVETTLLRAPGALFQKTQDGKLQNIYTVKVINKTNRQIPVSFRAMNLPANVKIMGGGTLTVRPADLAQTSLLVEMDPAVLTGTKTMLDLAVLSDGTVQERVKTVFIGPRTEP